ncbi:MULTISPECIES: MaoC family dehydratase [Gordonia]|uniref:MaoC family dehydratase n=3 Tax=Gordonia TaxID=2053 RepID=A0AAW6R9N5_GORRU|nr:MULTISPECIES: MaoC family dehydratase [Gordonia]MCK8613158.1 MaoC family dehydratase [Gordonia sp. C13]MDG6781085.1 MaoC family dehydratase [Gordonia rubripertincta]MDH3024898.1 MaoC family dehydratase [Gordonia alkanivorans]NKY62430.1 MaoC family dehydratase [Gordonia rubripertincta]QMU22440.1 MaoC family dehydratase [Gordonia rubripertincta]
MTNSTRTFTSVEELKAAIGEDLGSGEWLEITQERIDAFADATGDHQWIHTDPERAKSGPFGTTIAHGYLTVSLLPMLAGQIFTIEGPKLFLNYGMNKLRFPNPVKVGARIRSNAVITSIEETPKGVNMVVTNTVEIEGESKPACVAENLRVLVY